MPLGMGEIFFAVLLLGVVLVLLGAPKLLKWVSNKLYERKQEITDTAKDIKQTWTKGKKTVKEIAN